MRLRSSLRKPSCEISIAPLIDVVFLLIIFSMTVSHFTSAAIEEVALPEAEKGEPQDNAEPSQLVINIDRTGTVIISGQRTAPPDIDRFLAAEAKAPGDAHVTSVLIRSDRDTPWRAVAEVMNLCAKHNITSVRVAVVKPGDGSP